MSCLYFMTYLLDEDTFLPVDGKPVVKFGHTSNLEQRMAIYRSNMPLDVLLLATIPGGYSEEQHALSLFPEGSRHSGEWLYYDKVAATIDRLNQKSIRYTKRLYRKGVRKPRVSEANQTEFIHPGTNESCQEQFATWLDEQLLIKDTVDFKDYYSLVDSKKLKSLKVMLDVKYNSDSRIHLHLRENGIEVVRKPGRYGTTTFTKTN